MVKKRVILSIVVCAVMIILVLSYSFVVESRLVRYICWGVSVLGGAALLDHFGAAFNLCEPEHFSPKNDTAWSHYYRLGHIAGMKEGYDRGFGGGKNGEYTSPTDEMETIDRSICPRYWAESDMTRRFGF